jgi:nitroalkane oxidase
MPTLGRHYGTGQVRTRQRDRGKPQPTITHDYHGETIGAMCKVHCTEMMLDCVYKCMQAVGVNSLDLKHPFHRYLREASVFPLYNAGNFGMQRRRVHLVMADPGL